jgi:hypothetical protein
LGRHTGKNQNVRSLSWLTFIALWQLCQQLILANDFTVFHGGTPRVKSADFDGTVEAPNPKLQAPKFAPGRNGRGSDRAKDTNPCGIGAWDLGFGASLELWSLVLGASIASIESVVAIRPFLCCINTLTFSVTERRPARMMGKQK